MGKSNLKKIKSVVYSFQGQLDFWNCLADGITTG